MLCSLIIEAGHRISYSSIIAQNWDGFELIYINPDYNDISNPNKDDSSLLQHSFCKSVYQSDSTWRDIKNQAQGRYLSWIHPEEQWDDNFLADLKTELQKTSGIFTIPVGYGFIRIKKMLSFIANEYPRLLVIPSIENNLNKPLHYNPYIKFFFTKELIEEMQIPNDYLIDDWRERYAMFCFRYILGVQELTGGRNVEFDTFTAKFSLPDSNMMDSPSFKEYRDLIYSNKAKIAASPLEPEYWKLLYFTILNRLAKFSNRRIKSQRE